MKVSFPPVCGEKDVLPRLGSIGESFNSHSTPVMLIVLLGEKHLMLAVPLLGVKVNRFSGSKTTK